MDAAHAPLLRFWGARRLPLILQAEATECGLACLAMIAGYWGHRIDLAGMRRRFSLSLKGTTLKGLIAMAEALRLQPRPLKLELAKLRELRLPCVLHWDMNHFVVLSAVRGDRITIHDPGAGPRRLSLADASPHFTGIALELAPGARFAATRETRAFTLRALMGRVVGLRRALAQLLLLGATLQLVALAMPFYLQWVVDDALVAADRDLLSVLGAGFLMGVVVQAAIGAVRSWVTTALSTNLNFQWFGNAFAHLMRLPLPYFEKRRLGDIVSRFGSIQTIQHSLTTQFVEGVIDGLLMIGTLVVMALYSTTLTAVACGAVGLYAALRLAVFRSLRDATREQIVHAARQQSHFLESARAIQSIRLFDRAVERRSGWMNALAEQFNAELRVARLSISYQTASTLLFGAERVVVVWIAAGLVLDARFSIGMLLAFVAYQDQFAQRTAGLVDKLFDLRLLRLHGERVADIVMTEPEEEGGRPEVDLAGVAPTIALHGVAFRYADGEPDVLTDLSLTIPAGQCVAIVGASGCGKTTLVKLLLGLLEPTAGEIVVGGTALRRLGLAQVREMIGTVMQDDHLFVGSIADNIAFFDPRPDAGRVEAAARLAALHDEIARMPMGYESLVGDVGSSLSGGQKQRVLLARALYRNPKILVLDEATSHLDLANEQRVNAAIRQVRLTRIVVAHRPETIAMAERVVVLEAGRIVRDLAQPPAREPPA